MNTQKEPFLEDMWERVARKEADQRLAERLIKETREKPGRKSANGIPAFVRNVFCGMGLGRLYGGMADVLGIAFVIALLAMYLLVKGAREVDLSLEAAVFCGSPVLYASAFLLLWQKEIQSGTYELQMSLPYTFFHVLAARMLGSSLLGLAFDGLYVLMLFLRYEADGVRLMAVSFSSLMLFSMLLMAGMEWGRRFRWAVTLCSAWMLANLTAFFCFPRGYEALLGRIPVYLFLAAGGLGMLLYLKQLIFMTTLGFRREYSDAAD